MRSPLSFNSAVQVILLCLVAALGSNVRHASAEDPSRQYYEVRIYKIYDFEKQRIADDYLRDALLPALNRQKIENVGVFHNLKDTNDHSIYVIIPYANLESFSLCNEKLDSDSKYQQAASAYLQRKKGDGIFDRIESRLLRAFSIIPQMELADYSKNKTDRIFELRLYESTTEKQARLKIEMFNEGETQLMRDMKMAPVFFGETLAGPDLPNLVYMISAKSVEDHESHWKAFKASDQWKKMKVLPQYKDTVSNIKNWILAPTPYSQF